MTAVATLSPRSRRRWRNALQALNNMIIALSRGMAAIFRGGMALPSARQDTNNNGDFAR
jgi:hypothetical protein